MKKLLLSTTLATLALSFAPQVANASIETQVKSKYGGRVTVDEFNKLGGLTPEFDQTKQDTTKAGGSMDVDSFKAGKDLGLTKDDMVQVGLSDAMKAKIKAKGISKADVQTAAAAAKANPANAKATMDAAAGVAGAGAGGIPTPPPMPGTVEKEVFDLLGKKHGTPEQIAAYVDLKTFGLPAGHPNVDDINGYLAAKGLLKANPTFAQLDAYMNLSKNILKTAPSADEYNVFLWLDDKANAAEPAVVHFNTLADKAVFIVTAAKMAGANGGDKAKAQFAKATAGAGAGAGDPVGDALKAMGEADTPANRKIYTDLDAMLKAAGDARKITVFEFNYYAKMIDFGNASPTHADFLAFDKYFKIRKATFPSVEGYKAMQYAESNGREETYTRIMNTAALRTLFDASKDLSKLKDALDVAPKAANFDAAVSSAIDPAAGAAAAIDAYKAAATYVFTTTLSKNAANDLAEMQSGARNIELRLQNAKGNPAPAATVLLHPDALGKTDNKNLGIPNNEIAVGSRVYIKGNLPKITGGKIYIRSAIVRND